MKKQKTLVLTVMMELSAMAVHFRTSTDNKGIRLLEHHDGCCVTTSCGVVGNLCYGSAVQILN